MRLVGIELSGFRAFAGTQRFDLDADAVIVVGANGQGKTSLFDGVLWGLTGVIPRLGKDSRVISMYSSSGTARVQLELRHPHGTSMTVVRSFDGKQELLRVELDGAVFQADAARVKLLEILWPEALVTADARAALSAAMSRSVYLQQDLVREFIEADSDQERFTAVSELVGAGRVTELQVQLDNQRTAWTRTINSLTKDVEAAQQRVDRLQSQLLSLGDSGAVPIRGVETTWSTWWEDARRMGVGISPVPMMVAPDAASSLDQGIKQLQALLRSNDRRREVVADLLSEVGRPAGATDTEADAPIREALEAALAEESRVREMLA